MPNANTQLYDSERYLWEVIENLNTPIGKLLEIKWAMTILYSSIRFNFKLFWQLMTYTIISSDSIASA